MLKLWKTGSAIFLLQWLGYFVVAGFLDEGNVEKARVVEAIIAAGISISAGLLALVGEKIVKEIDSLTICLLAAAAAIIQLPRDLIPGLTGIDNLAVLSAFMCILVAVWRERKESESILGCFATAIPGLGMFIGGVILLYRRWQQHRHVSAM